ncbi:MAG: hypothetical protein RI560_13820, partial [Natronomonas sp.]|nr:hypothetical protein [Natronomonas sp.]
MDQSIEQLSEIVHDAYATWQNERYEDTKCLLTFARIMVDTIRDREHELAPEQRVKLHELDVTVLPAWERIREQLYHVAGAYAQKYGNTDFRHKGMPEPGFVKLADW